MRGTTKWAMVVIVLLLGTMVVGCDGWNPFSCFNKAASGADSVSPVTGLKVEGAKPVAVGTALQLHGSAVYAEGEEPSASDRAQLQNALRWEVEPSDGATVSPSGLFKATKPDVYTVTVSVEGVSTSASAQVTVTEETETTEETEEETSTTTEATVTNTFAGTYRGTWLWKAGKDQANVPWEFTVDDEGNVKGGWDTLLGADLKNVCVLSGQVADDGQVAASGTATSTASYGTGSQPMTLSGQISDGTFTGKLVGKGGQAVVVTAKLK